MNDGLNELLRQRFAAHETSVPQDAWEQISGKLAAHADGTHLRETLQEKFQGHEVPVDPSAWVNISGRIGATGMPAAYRWAAGGLAALAIGALFLWNATETPSTPQRQAETAAVPPAVAVPATATVPANTTEVPITDQPIAEKAMSVQDKAERKPAPAVISNTIVTEEPASPAPDPITEEHAPDVQVVPAPLLERTVPVPPKPAPVQMAPAENPKPSMGQTGNTAQPEKNIAIDEPAEAMTETNPELPVPTPEFNIYIPSAFTVNGDGLNDKLRIVADEHEAVEVLIATTGGAQVFHSNDLARMWDGRMPNGNIAPDGLYHCLVSITDIRGAVHYKTEVVRLFR